ncbi:uncharacterized protein MEPE_03381 [Melanopsichium pennsylvanicum]|uniref:Uncharacterized protein n=2 Tax=Melanopsichium pennsylvanicum TaxID=63383 RepID=A0AAJ4XMP9_9BASI|nr:putative protein [Melanopsichium pennsylvanicum 4]SNX84672.1 uncharacterized protein MEPE_03381 [Melanopsichium pennsylvanicum]
MKFISASLLVLSAALLAHTSSATPLVFNADNDQISVPIQLPFSSTPRILTFPNWFHNSASASTSADDDDDICPRLPVQCVKDGEIVGDLGEQDFCRQGLTCKMCHPKKKALDCNTKYIKECKAQCEARGPLGGKAAQLEHTVELIKHKVQDLFAEDGGDDDDICPDMKVSCKNVDGKTVGDIGKKPFCRDGLTCGQCHQTENSAECNVKFLKDCKAQCEATGPLGGKGGVFVHLF